MRIAMMGAGGLGGYFGARLCLGGADVHFVARGRHLQAMREHGPRVEGPAAIRIPRVSATDDPSTIGVVDFVLVGVKLWDTESATGSRCAGWPAASWNSASRRVCPRR